MAKFYVMDDTNNTSYADDGNEPQVFDTKEAAVARAEELAANAPGSEYFVTQAITVSRCDVKPAKTTKLKNE